MDSSNFSSDLCTGDIETNPVGDVATDAPVTKQVPTDLQNLKTVDNLTTYKTGESGPAILDSEVTQDLALDDIIIKALEKVKEYFYQNEIEEHRLAEFMYKILTLNMKDLDSNEIKFDSDALNKLVDQITETSGTKDDPESLNDLLENLFGEDAAKSLNEKLRTENIDEIVECLLGKETKNIICNRLESDNLDELLNKLIEEKLTAHSDPLAKHPNFDDFIEKILGKETKEFIRQKLQIFLNESENIDEVLVKEQIE